MASEIEKAAQEITKKKASEIEKTAQEIETVCDSFVKLNDELVKTGKEIDFKTKDKLEKIGTVLKNFYMKSSGIEETWRLNESQFEEGRLERDAYERKLRELTENMSSLKFDFNKCLVEIKAFERRVATHFGLDSKYLTPKMEEKRTKEAIVDLEAQDILTSTKKASFAQEKKEIKGKQVSRLENNVELGISYAKNKEPAKAKEFFEIALISKPNNATIWFHLGHANSALGNHSEAIRCYQKVLEINPKHIAALFDLGFSYGQLGKHTQARKCYRKLTEMKPNDAKAWTGLGVTFYSLGKFKQAKQFFEKAVQINPEFGLAWYNLGLVFSSLGYHEESERCFDQAKKLGYS